MVNVVAKEHELASGVIDNRLIAVESMYSRTDGSRWRRFVGMCPPFQMQQVGPCVPM